METESKTAGQNLPNPEPSAATPPAGAIQPTPEEFQKIKDDLDSFKRELSTRDKKISSLQKEIESKELEKLSEVEREKKEAELAKAEKEKTLLEIEQIKLDRIKDQELNNAGIPVQFAKRINGQTELEIQSDVKEFKTFIDNLVKAEVTKKINEKLSGTPPTSGQTPEATTYQSAYDEAMKAGKMAEATAIKRQAGKEGVEIKG